MNQGRVRVLFLMFSDAIVLSLVWGLSAYVWALFSGGDYDIRYVCSRWDFLCAYLVLNLFSRLYHGNPFYPGAPLAPVEEFRRLVLTSLATGALFFAYLAFYNKSTAVEPGVVVLTVALNILFAQVGRNVMRRVLRSSGVGQMPVVLVGPKTEATYLTRILGNSPHYGFKVVSVFEKATLACEWARQHNVKHCISCQPLRVFRASIRRFLAWFSVLISMPEPQIFPIAMTRPVDFAGYGGLEMANQLRQKGIVHGKRVAEWLFSLVALCLLLLPGIVIALCLMIAYRDSHIFYCTERLGKRQKRFTIWKFRTMIPDADARLKALLASDAELRAEWESTGKLRNDPRITSFGRLLRKTSLDEIPQLFNVLRGDMALIGPRPIVSREVPCYGEHYDIVSKVKPGITGLWQVSGRSDVDYEARVALDLYYAQNWNLWLDCWIFLRTFVVVLCQRGAC